MRNIILSLFIYSSITLLISCSAYKPTHLELAEEYTSIAESALRNSNIARNSVSTGNDEKSYESGAKALNEVANTSYETANYHLNKVDKTKLNKDQIAKLSALLSSLKAIKSKM